MNITKCVNGHFFDSDKFKFCPHCGANVEGDDKSKEKPNRPDMVMGMMKPPEPVIRGNMRCVDEFVSEDPINTDTHVGGIMLEPTNSNECRHDFAVVEVYTGGSEYVCKKCGTKKVITTMSPELPSFIIEPNQFDPTQYVMLPQGTTTVLYSDTLNFTIKDSGENKVFNMTEVNVGRDQSNDHHIANTYVARRQATFLYEHHIWFLRDNNSTNGTYINGKRLESGKKYQLASNDEISFSNQETIIFNKLEWNMPILEECLEDNLLDKKIANQYIVLKLLGKGAFFKTYLVMDKKQNKQWAMKVYDKNRQSYSPILRNIILNEAHMMMGFNHISIPKIADIIEDDNTICIIREYIFGDSLDVVVRDKGPIAQENVLKWAEQLCDVLGYLHKQNPPYVYRDMKPANIILQPCGDIKLVDFGSASLYDAVREQSDVCCILGTLGYAAPEQYAGKIDPRSDIYSLGVTLYHLITGISPNEPPYELKPIRTINSNLSQGLESIILKCTQLNPDERFQNCDELMIALQGGPVNPDKKKGFFKKLFNKKEDGWDSIHRMASKELKKIGNKKCIFKCDCMVDVTYFDAKDPTDSLGYAYSANILVFSDGKISVIGDQEAERFHISSVLSYNDNIGNYNPSHEHEVKFILADRAIVIGFYDKDKFAKKELTDKLKQVVLKEKK